MESKQETTTGNAWDGFKTTKYQGIDVTLDELMKARDLAEINLKVSKEGYLTAVTDFDLKWYKERIGLHEDKIIELNAVIESLAK